MPAIQHLKHLINLALVDGQIVEKEREYILSIGRANHFDTLEMMTLFATASTETSIAPVTDEQKFDYLFDLVQLMKIDEKLYREEIRYCAKVASRLGYKEQVLFELMLKVKSTTMGKDEIESLKKLTKAYLKQG